MSSIVQYVRISEELGRCIYKELKKKKNDELQTVAWV